jgi:SAM-dependent methyltransferase
MQTTIKTMSARSKQLNDNIPSWPKERDLATYSKYTKIDFTQDLSSKKTWIDVGCRTGKALSQTRQWYDAKLIGINAHEIKVQPGIQPILACIPEDIRVYTRYQQKADLLTDIHGAISYCENPLEALIYEACLLKPKAKAVIVTLAARLGSPVTWKRVKEFFSSVLKQSIEFKRFTTYSDNTKTPIKTVRITIQGMSQSELDLPSLFAEARKYVGQMKKVKVIAEPDDKSFQIWKVKYLMDS